MNAADPIDADDVPGLCDHCGKEVDPQELPDCEPDDTGHCILCGLPRAVG